MTTFNSHRAFYKNAKQAFYENAGKVMIITTLAALLVFTPSIATAQSHTVLPDGTPSLNGKMLWNFTDEDILFDETGDMLWDSSDAVEKIVQNDAETVGKIVCLDENSGVGRWVH